LTFIALLRVRSKESKSSRLHRPRVWLHTSHNAVSTGSALERGCSIATIRAETSRLVGDDQIRTHQAGVIRTIGARFDKRAEATIPKSDNHSAPK